MKNNLKLLLAFSLISSFQLTAQTTYPKENIQATIESLTQRMNSIESLTALTEISTTNVDSLATDAKPQPSNQTIIRTVYDGSKNLNETRSLKYAGEEKVVRIGNGSFKNILYVDKLTNQVIKIKHIDTMEYMYEVGEDEKANTERIEVNIYYANEKPFYAVFKEDHYKKPDELLFSNEYNIQMATYHNDVYFTNDFQKTIHQYAQELSDTILKQK